MSSPELLPGYSSTTVRPREYSRGRHLGKPLEARSGVAGSAAHEDVGAGRSPERCEVTAGVVAGSTCGGQALFVGLDRSEPRQVPPVRAAGHGVQEAIPLTPDPDRRVRALDGSRPAHGPLS